MSSHDVRIVIEHYASGGFGVITDKESVMGIIELEDAIRNVEVLMKYKLEKLEKAK